MLTDLLDISEANILVKQLKLQRSQLAALKLKIEKEILKGPEKDAILRQIDEAFLEVLEQEKKVKRKKFSDEPPEEKPLVKKDEQEEIDPDKIAKVQDKESPEAKETRQTKELTDLDRAMRLVSNRVPGAADEFIRTLGILLGKKGELDTTLQAALNDPEILQRIFNEIEQVRLNINKKLGLAGGFSKEGGFEPQQIGGVEVSTPTLDPPPLRDLDKDKLTDIPDIPDKKDPGKDPSVLPTASAPAGMIKADIRTVLFKIRDDVIKNIDSPKQRALFDQDEQLFQESQQVAARALRQAMENKLKKPGTEPKQKKTQTIEPDSLNESATAAQLNDLAKNFTVKNVEELEDATGGKANSVESLKDLLEEQQLDPSVPKEEIQKTKDRLEIAEQEEIRLAAIDRKMDILGDAIGCAESDL